MEAFLQWLRDLPPSIWVAESDTVWAYPFVLFVHTVGIALTGGSAAVILMRVLGFARSLPLPAMRKLFPSLWAGFVLNAISGTLLFNAAATTTGYNPTYYLKLVLLLFATLTLLPVRTFIYTDRAGSGSGVPFRVQGFAALSLFLWAGVVATGRLIAYLA